MEKLCLLINSILDPLQGNLSRNAQRITLKDILAPLNSIPLYVVQKLLDQDPLIVKLFFLLALHRQIEFDLRLHFVDGVVER